MLDYAFSVAMRHRIIKLPERKVLIANMIGSLEAQDEMTSLNCRGFGRIRRFSRFSIHFDSGLNGQAAKPLLRGHPLVPILRTQVFQLAACNWRCWYCFVDNALLAGDARVGEFLSAEELIDLYLEEEDRPDVIDLSGGQPDLAPEWTLWMMEALSERGLRSLVYLWSDDDLGTNFLCECLSERQIEYMANFPHYSRVGCFKGFDESSFVFNTGASPIYFQSQFDIFRGLLRRGFQMYAYATLTASSYENIDDRICAFVDRLQEIHPKLPLRTIPLRIRTFSATKARMKGRHTTSIAGQDTAFASWNSELRRRFGGDELLLPYESVDLTQER